MSDINWIDARVLELLHRESLVQHGGSPGFRDEDAYEAALARPPQLRESSGNGDVPSLAACYGYELAKTRPFTDGNKRAAFAAVGLFLLLNGWRLTAPTHDAALVMNALTSGEMTETEFATWIRTNCQPK